MGDLKTQLSELTGLQPNQTNYDGWSVDEEAEWIVLKKDNLKLVVSAAILELWTSGLPNIPNNLENHGPLMNQTRKPQRVTRRVWEQYGLPYYRFANWLRVLGSLDPARQFLFKTQSHRGFNSERTLCDLWRVWERHPSPGGFARWLQRTIKKAREISQPLGFRPSWYSIAITAEKGPRRTNKAAVFAVALNLRDDISSYRQARECLSHRSWRNHDNFVHPAAFKAQSMAETTVYARYIAQVFSPALSWEIRSEIPEGIVENLKPHLRRKVLKTWRRYNKDIPEENRVHSFIALVKLFIAFGRRPDEVLGLVDRGHISLHDAGIGLPNTSISMEMLEWAIQHKEGWENVPTIIGAWDRLVKGGWDPWERGSKDEAIHLLHTLGIVSVKNRAFARWASIAGYSDNQAQYVEDVWERSRAVRTYSAVPNVYAEYQGWTIRRLADDDPLVPLAGAVVNCCQHPLGVGSSCAWHAVSNENGAIWAVFDDKGNLLAQSWVWRAEDVLILDSVEMRAGYMNNTDKLSIISHLYNKACQQCVQEQSLGVTHIYKGFQQQYAFYIEMVRDEKRPIIENEYLDAIGGVYTDAKSIIRLAPEYADEKEDPS